MMMSLSVFDFLYIHIWSREVEIGCVNFSDLLFISGHLICWDVPQEMSWSLSSKPNLTFNFEYSVVSEIRPVSNVSHFFLMLKRITYKVLTDLQGINEVYTLRIMVLSTLTLSYLVK